SKWASGYNLSNTTAAGDGDLIACALGTGSVKITKTLPLGKYWFTVDGSRGSFCSYTINTSPAILPIYLIDFQVFQESNGVQVQWTTLQSQDVERFEIETSTDGKDFEVSGSYDPSGSYGMASFQYFIANSFQSKPLYYRLKSISVTGEITYSKIISPFSSDSLEEFKLLYFDQSSQALVMNSSFKDEYGSEIQLLNVSGQTVFSKEIQVVPGVNQIRVSSNSLPNGVYYLIFISGMEWRSQKLVVLN
ncbi:MAG: T9SS type A sorting domain-containing protein, partial [Cytophagales bacterium]|nr:T9SS type A sorting domain-containing protein [Cytophagales bacterium]